MDAECKTTAIKVYVISEPGGRRSLWSGSRSVRLVRRETIPALPASDWSHVGRGLSCGIPSPAGSGVGRFQTDDCGGMATTENGHPSVRTH
eukprot:1175753-Prorocentrum_minimum.AAC.5